MDWGPQWPFWLRWEWGFIWIVLLARMAWRQAGAAQGWHAAALLLAWWALVVLARVVGRAACFNLPIDLPGCDWGYHRAPTDAGRLFWFISVGGLYHVLRLGAPLAALVFTSRALVRGVRHLVRAARARLPERT